MRSIANQGQDNCVGVAISTMRLALGYDSSLPSWYKNGAKKLDDGLTRTIAQCFQAHKVNIWCKESQYFYNPNSVYCGESFKTEDFEDCLIAFAYNADGKEKDRPSHMVVGHPSLYDGMSCQLVIAIEVDTDIVNLTDIIDCKHLTSMV